mmetsp:Transcript_9772/g.23437  ORF Transcript_9772/g.23437 Transcript_9772/m.23437 type:complete len:202 (-) Transcript_9772:191-796(-)
MKEVGFRHLNFVQRCRQEANFRLPCGIRGGLKRKRLALTHVDHSIGGSLGSEATRMAGEDAHDVACAHVGILDPLLGILELASCRRLKRKLHPQPALRKERLDLLKNAIHLIQAWDLRVRHREEASAPCCTGVRVTPKQKDLERGEPISPIGMLADPVRNVGDLVLRHLVAFLQLATGAGLVKLQPKLVFHMFHDDLHHRA